MQLRERATIASLILACAGLGVAAWIALDERAPADRAWIVPVPAPVVVTRTIPAEPPPPEDLGAPASITAAPGCAPALAEAVRGWLAEPARTWIRFDPSRGITFAHSEVDTGKDGPYPKHYGPEAKQACGSEAAWLRSHVRAELRQQYELSCCDRTCSYGGMEYAPGGTVHFEQRDGEWILVGWEETYVAALGEEYARRNTRYVQRAMARLAGARCAGEAPGLDLE